MLKRNQSGFTLIELTVTLVISAAILAVAYAFLRSSMSQLRAGEGYTNVQQNLRVAGEVLADEVRVAGYGIDYGSGQQGLVYAGPWDIVFNANVNPEPDVFGDPHVPVAMDPGASPSTVPAGGGTVLYAPSAAYGSGAETIRFTLDSDGDGSVTTADHGDDEEETEGGDRDYVLSRHVFGSDSSGSNGGAREKVAVCAGPSADPAISTLPLFQYLYDHDNDPSSALKLWGDASGDLALSAAEIAAISPVSSSTLPQVQRVRVTLTGDTKHLSSQSATLAASGPTGSTFRTEIGLRNKPRTLGILWGIVFNDTDQDGVQDVGEGGVAGARIVLSTGARTTTGFEGTFYFEVDPASYTVSETDPAGFTSTTSNLVSTNVTPGAIVQVDFGDRSLAGNGWIRGTVWNDADGDTTISAGEWGIRNVSVYLNNGARDTSDIYGQVSFYVPVNSYTVYEVDSTGYLSTTSNQVNVTIAADGDTVFVAFGDRLSGSVGTIVGTVFTDDDEDGIQDGGESGLAQVAIHLSNGDSTLTDSQGEYSFSVDAATYGVTEVDLDNYVSTTPNDVTGVVVQGDSTVTVNFGDRPETELNFDEIVVSNTDRALSVKGADLQEDNKGDKDIILGTRFATGVSNILVFFAGWTNSNTPNASIFSNTASYTRSGGDDVTALGVGSLGSDAVPDVASGLYATVSNLKIWQTQTSGSNKGKLPNSPNNTYSTGLGAQVEAIAVGNVRGSAALDLVVGTRQADGLGRIEIWTNSGTGTYTLGGSDTYTMGASGSQIGEPFSIAIGQLDGKHGDDIAVATRLSDYTGRLEIFFEQGNSGNFFASKTYTISGRGNAVAVVDMKEDAAGDNDIVVGTSSSAGNGRLELWLNVGSGNFGVYNSLSGYWEKSDSVAVAGEVLSLAATQVDPDVYPDVFVGINSTLAYQGSLVVYRAFGYLPNSGTVWSGSEIGEVVTLDAQDFNKDGLTDVVVGTRTGSSSGKLVVYFQR